MESSKIIVTPNCESGLMTQRSENTVLQALESLSESQVTNFLSGKAPLNLNMRFGDHVMLIQLQLSNVNPTNGAVKNCASPSRKGTHNRVHYPHPRSNRLCTHFTTTFKTSPTIGMRSVSTPRRASAGSKNGLRCHQYLLNNNISATNSAIVTVPSPTPISTDECKVEIETQLTPLPNRNITHIPGVGIGIGLKKSWPLEKDDEAATKKNIVPKTADFKGIAEAHLLEQSPIKSLSNLVTSSIKATAVKEIPHVIPGTNTYSNSTFTCFSAPIITSTTTTKTTTTTLTALEPHPNSFEEAVASLSTCRDPIAAKLTSCLCTRLNGSNVPHTACSKPNHNSGNLNPAQQQLQKPLQIPFPHDYRSQYCWQVRSQLGSTSNCLVLRKLNTVNNKGVATNVNSNFTPPPPPPPPSSSSGATNLRATGVCSSLNKSPEHNATSSSRNISIDVPSNASALAEASRSLTETLRKLSKEMFSSKGDFSNIEEGPRTLIESMKRHGKGIYSGTFSGTLNPALQDRCRQQKGDISTVVHILNDMLSTTPQYSRGGRITVETPDPSRTPSAAASSNGSLNSMHNTSSSPKTPASINTLKSAGSGGNWESSGPVFSVSMTTATPHHNEEKVFNGGKMCQCCGKQSETEQGEGEYTCPKCISYLANMKTKSKMNQLRLAMQQRKQNRENRKMKSAPYGARGKATAITSDVNEKTSDTPKGPVNGTTSTTQSNPTP